MPYKPEVRPIGKTKHYVGLRTSTNDHSENNKLRHTIKDLVKSGGKKRVEYYTKTPAGKRTYEDYQEYLYNMKRCQSTNNKRRKSSLKHVK